MITSRYVNFLPDKSISLFMQPVVLIINGLHQAISLNPDGCSNVRNVSH